MMEPDLLQQCIAKMLHDELECRRLDVYLSPAWGSYGDDGKQLRVAMDQNPRWYREFCAAYPANRSRPRRRSKPDTIIKRRHTLRALREIAAGRAQTTYARRLLPIVIEETKRFQVAHELEQVEAWLQ
jgi:hypothetical protein